MAKIELLAPAGNLEKAKTAILYGADAVYVGGKSFSLRSRASNFEIKDIQELCQFAHDHDARVHVTVNMLPHPEDFEGLEEYLAQLDQAGVDALIIASPSIAMLAKKLNLHCEVHISTQHSSTNSQAAAFWKTLGMDRIVLARECTLEEVEAVSKNSSLPVEVFIHGGMCISFSGRCVLSNHMTLRDANRGGCAQSCRWKYHLYEKEEDGRAGKEISEADMMFSMSSKDLQAVDYIEDLMRMGVASLKIEGRMKSAYYLATVVGAYRRLIDHIEETGHADEAFLDEIKQEIAKAENRPTAQGFYPGIPHASFQLYARHDETVTQEFIAKVLERVDEDWILVEVRNKFEAGAEAELFGPQIHPVNLKIEKIKDLEGVPLQVCNNPMTKVLIEWKGPAPAESMIRLKRKAKHPAGKD